MISERNQGMEKFHGRTGNKEMLENTSNILPFSSDSLAFVDEDSSPLFDELLRLRLDNEKKAKRLEKLQLRLDRLKKAAGAVCQKIEKAQKTRVGTQRKTGNRTCERLITVSNTEKEGKEREKGAETAILELESTFETAKRLWIDYFPYENRTIESRESQSLLENLNVFLEKMMESVPIISVCVDSAKRCQCFLQRITNSAIVQGETAQENTAFQRLSALIAGIEQSLSLISAEKSAFQTPNQKKTRSRSRISLSCSEKILRSEVELRENCKSDIKFQRLLFETEQLKDEQSCNRLKICELLRKISDLDCDNKLLKDKVANMEEAMQQLEEKLATIKSTHREEGDFPPSEVHFKLDELDQSIKELLITMQNEKRETLLQRLRKITAKNWEFSLGTYFARWKNASFSMSFAGTGEDDPLNLWKMTILQRNPLLDGFALDDSSLRTPMPPVIVLKTIDELMLHLSEGDLFPSSQSFPSSAIDFLAEKLKSRPSALRTLRQAIPTLRSFTEDEYYGRFLARVMQVQDPFSDSVIRFFVEVNREAFGLVRKRMGAGEFINTESGGKLLLSDALELLYSLEIAKDENLCRKVINYLRGTDMDKRDYVLFVVSHKMNQTAVDPSELFTGAKSIPLPSFVSQLKLRLGLCISEKKLLSAFQTYQAKGKISLADFRKTVSVQTFALSATSDRFTVDRFYFLYVLSFVYDYTVDRSVELLQSAYEANCLEDGWEVCFWKSISSVEGSLSEGRCRELTEEARRFFGKEPLDERHFLAFVAEKHIAGYFWYPLGKNFERQTDAERSRTAKDTSLKTPRKS